MSSQKVLTFSISRCRLFEVGCFVLLCIIHRAYYIINILNLSIGVIYTTGYFAALIVFTNHFSPVPLKQLKPYLKIYFRNPGSWSFYFNSRNPLLFVVHFSTHTKNSDSPRVITVTSFI